MRTVRVDPSGDLPPIYALAPMPGELPVAVWRLDHSGPPAEQGRVAHSHEFPVITYFETASGSLSTGGQVWPIAAGDVFVIAPGDIMGPFDTSAPADSRGWAVSFTAEALGRDVPGSSQAWRTHPLLFPFVRGRASGALRLSVPPSSRPEWTERVATLARELEERADGYPEAALAHLTLLLVGVSRLAADVVDNLRVNREPLLAEVFAVIERRYPEALSLRDVAREVSMSAGHLTTTVRRRTGRTVQEWIIDRRMVQARRLLAGTALPIREVGRRVGYPDPGYFARVFGGVHGVSPSEWRAAG
jgi:AraC family transcriptional regulator, transcriptional activator of pobA